MQRCLPHVAVKIMFWPSDQILFQNISTSNNILTACVSNVYTTFKKKNLNQLFESQDSIQKEVHCQQLLVFNLSIKGNAEKRSEGIRRLMKRGKEEGKWEEKSTKLCFVFADFERQHAS